MNCILCAGDLEPFNRSEICTECRTLVQNLLNEKIPERWAPAADDLMADIIVSDRGRIARLLRIDRAHRYPRVTIRGRKYYLHTLVAAAFHGPRPRGQLVLHGDDDPNHPDAGNLRYGTPGDNSRDRRLNRARRIIAQREEDP
jgi:hypothetical protein